MNQGSGNVLYHGVSSYQLLEVILHRLLFHREEKAVLLLPDFIREKYPQWEGLSPRFFQEVRLFPYLSIPHGEEAQVVRDTAAAYESLDLPSLEEFSRIYIAGAHFYFALYVISQGLPFAFFEDAAGMLSRPEEAAAVLAAKFPQHAALAQANGLFAGNHPLIREVFCCWEAQSGPVETRAAVWDFSVERALKSLPWKERRRLVRFFVKRPLKTRADTILLTQQFSNLGLMGEEEQRSLYRNLAQGPLAGRQLLVKPHPDDPLDYHQVFPGAQVVDTVFPAELLPYVFRGRKPKTVAAFSSAGLCGLEESFQVLRLPAGEAACPQEPVKGPAPCPPGPLAGHPSM